MKERNLYLNFILTVIAAALIFNAIKPLLIPRKVEAYEDETEIVNVNVTQVGGREIAFGALPVAIVKK